MQNINANAKFGTSLVQERYQNASFDKNTPMLSPMQMLMPMQKLVLKNYQNIIFDIEYSNTLMAFSFSKHTNGILILFDYFITISCTTH